MLVKLFEIGIMFFCFLVFFIISNRIYSRRFNIVNAFNILWCGGGILAVCGFYRLYEIDVITVMVICVISCVFSITACAYSNRYVLINSEKDYLIFDSDDDFNLRIIIALNIFAIAFTLYLSKDMILILINEGFTTARYYFLTASENGRAYSTLQIYMMYACFSVFTATELTLAQSIMAKKRNNILILLGIIDLIVYTVAISGRKMILSTILYIGLGFLYSNKKIKITFKYKILIVSGMVALVYITLNRLLGVSVFENVYLYFIGPFKYLDIVLTQPELFKLADGLLYGCVIFGALTSTLEIIGSLLFGYPYVGIDQAVTAVSEVYYLVAPNRLMNHSSTAALYFMMDYGYFGIIVGFAFVAILCAKSHHKACTARKKRSVWQCLFLYFSTITFFTIVDYQFMNWNNALVIVVLIVFTFRGKKRRCLR